MTPGVVYAVLAFLLAAYTIRLWFADRKDKRAKEEAGNRRLHDEQMALTGGAG